MSIVDALQFSKHWVPPIFWKLVYIPNMVTSWWRLLWGKNSHVNEQPFIHILCSQKLGVYWNIQDHSDATYEHPSHLLST